MGVIGSLFAKHNDFNATGQHIDQGQLAANGYNTTTGLPQQIQAGLNQSDITNGNQDTLASQLLARSQGKGGPSPAETQLAQSLGQIQQQGAGTIAGARGVSPGTALRLIGQNQTQAAGQAAGQAATLRANETLGAENALGSVLAQQRSGQLGQAQIAGGIQQGQNQTAAGIGQANQAGDIDAQRINAGVAQSNTNADNAMGSGLMSGVGGALALAHGGEVEAPGMSLAEQLVRSHASMAAAHEKVMAFHHTNLDTQRLADGGTVMQPKSYRENASAERVQPSESDDDAEETAFERHLKERDRARESNKEQDTENTMRNLGETVQNKAKGGEVKKSKPVYVPHEGPMDVSPTSDQTSAQPGQEGTDSEGNKKVLKLAGGGAVPGYAGGGLIGAGVHALGQLLGIGPNDAVVAGNTEGGKTYAMDPNGYNPQYGTGSTFGPDASDETGGGALNMGPPSAMAGTPAPGVGMAAAGGNVPGHAKVPGNSLKNDTVPTMLSPGEVVLPRTISHDPDAAADFVRHVNSRKRMATGGEVDGPQGYAKVLDSHRQLHERVTALEAQLKNKKTGRK